MYGHNRETAKLLSTSNMGEVSARFSGALIVT